MTRACLLLAITLLATRAGMAADLHVRPVESAARVAPISQGPVGTCRIYLQGRSTACRITTEPACQRLSEVWHKPYDAIVLRRWSALPEGLAWDMPPC